MAVKDREMAKAALEFKAAATDVDIAAMWLTAFENAVRAGDRAALDDLFIEDSHWRDLFIFTWTITPRNGREDVVSALLESLTPVKPRNFRVTEARTQPRRVTRAGEKVIETIYEFETDYARGEGVLRQPVDAPEMAWMISTSLYELKGAEWPIEDRRPSGKHDRLFGGETKTKRRARELEYADRDPAVLVVGGGHNGVQIGAQLRMLGVDALAVDRLPNVGDVWRNRYDSLALHNKVHLNHFPFMKYPETWPIFLTKDALADWIEAYAKAMEVNIWTGTEFTGASWNEEKKNWTATVRRADGAERVLYPRHIVFANGGIVGQPKHPTFPGLDDFKGELVHSHDYVAGERWRGRNVVIIGVGNTAHDVAQDLHGYGARVTMIQRGSLTVFSVEAVTLNHALYYNQDTPLEDCDLIATSPCYPVALRGYQLNVQKMLEIDKELLDGLRARGMKLDIGEDGGGHQMKIRKQHGGYYLNVGCSDLIVSGEVGLIQTEDAEKFVEDGLLMKDGTLVKADIVVTATGYEPPTKELARLLGEDIAVKVGPIWGLDPKDRELQNMYKPTPQQGLWFVAGGFAQGRVWTRYIALQIAAREKGIVSDPIPAMQNGC